VRCAAFIPLLAVLCGASVAAGQPAPSTDAANPCATRPDEIRRARERAVWRGIRWMQRFLRFRKHLDAIGSDAPCLFLELYETSPSARVRKAALAEARRLARRLLPTYLARRSLRGDRLYHAMGLLGFAAELRLGARGERLAEKVTKALAGPAPEIVLLGEGAARPAHTTSDEKFDLLMGAYTLERARHAFPGRFVFRYGLHEVLAAIAGHAYVGYDADTTKHKQRYYDDAYLASHVAFVLTDYGRAALDLRLMPRSWEFLRRHLARFLRDEHIELAAETLDVARAAGLGERDDPELCRAARFLLASQKRDGSWGEGFSAADPYDGLHETWTAVHALRSRIRAPTPLGDRFAAIARGLRGL
jgi:hypothetical protein